MEATDSQRLEEERVQKLNAVIQNNDASAASAAIPAPDVGSLLTSKDVEPLRQSLLQRPPDSYILAGLRWMFRSVKASLDRSFAPPKGLQPPSDDDAAAAAAAAAAQAEREAQEQAAAAAAALAAQQQQQQKTQDGFRMSSDGRTLSKALTDEQAKMLHPKIAAARTEILDMEKKAHETLDRVMLTRIKYLSLPETEPPCSQEMRVVADCYAQFASKKYSAAVFLEKQTQTPEIIRKQQQADAFKAKKEQEQQQQQQKGKQKAQRPSNANSDPYADLPEELLAGPQVLKLSTSILSCREVAKRLNQCAETANANYVERGQLRN
jgi:hypothetical protein